MFIFRLKKTMILKFGAELLGRVVPLQQTCGWPDIHVITFVDNGKLIGFVYLARHRQCALQVFFCYLGSSVIISRMWGHSDFPDVQCVTLLQLQSDQWIFLFFFFSPFFSLFFRSRLFYCSKTCISLSFNLFFYVRFVFSPFNWFILLQSLLPRLLIEVFKFRSPFTAFFCVPYFNLFYTAIFFPTYLFFLTPSLISHLSIFFRQFVPFCSASPPFSHFAVFLLSWIGK